MWDHRGLWVLHRFHGVITASGLEGSLVRSLRGVCSAVGIKAEMLDSFKVRVMSHRLSQRRLIREDKAWRLPTRASGSCIETQVPGPHPRVATPRGQPSVCILNKLPGDADLSLSISSEELEV